MTAASIWNTRPEGAAISQRTGPAAGVPGAVGTGVVGIHDERGAARAIHAVSHPTVAPASEPQDAGVVDRSPAPRPPLG